MQRASGYCRLNDGNIIINLPRLHCFVYGSDFFNLLAMEKIREFRASEKKVNLETV